MKIFEFHKTVKITFQTFLINFSPLNISKASNRLNWTSNDHFTEKNMWTSIQQPVAINFILLFHLTKQCWDKNICSNIIFRMAVALSTKLWKKFLKHCSKFTRQLCHFPIYHHFFKCVIDKLARRTKTI